VTNLQSRLEPADQPPALERPRNSRADEATLSALYEEHRTEILGFLVRMTQDRAAAEDVLQETFVSLIAESRAGRMPERVRAWLYRTATNAVISRSRRRSSFARLLPRLLDRREPEQPEIQSLRLERESDLHAALARLVPDARAALLLAAQGFGGAEIAVAIGRSEGATRTLMCRARTDLRHELEAAEAPR
jgi:RNA polymerase sigma factor (sigma-70 family)